jgi:hypothetical protein
VSEKKPFILRLNAKAYAALEKWAADEFRSVNGQLEYIIDKALKDSKRLKKDVSGNSDHTSHLKDGESSQ